jgi:hypothetical protein
MDEQVMDVDTADTLASGVRLLRQAAVLAWAAADRAEAGLPGQFFALGLDLAADQVQHLIPDGIEGWSGIASNAFDEPGKPIEAHRRLLILITTFESLDECLLGISAPGLLSNVRQKLI